MSKYPAQIDSDAELPRISDNLSETATEAINALREAVFAIEKTIGANPQGSTATLVDRLSQFFNDDGTAKSTALIAAGLIALPITNSMISASAAIVESKLDLDVATQDLQDAISSNDIDITALQEAIVGILARYSNHINGIADKHDGYDILLDSLYPSSTPPWLVGITASEVSTAIAAMNNRFISHAADSGAHAASAISVDASGLTSVISNNVQGAIEELDASRAVELVDHRDDMHSNGVSLWANSTDGYSFNNQIIPSPAFGTTVSAYIQPSARNVIDFISLTMSSFSIKQGDSVVVHDTDSAGTYIVNDIGPRGTVGTKPSLTASQVEVVGTFAVDGYVTAGVYGSSSALLLKGNLAASVRQSDIRTDSLQVSRPNAARVVSLGSKTKFLDASGVLLLEVGVSSTVSRIISINGLNKDRNGSIITEPTVDTLVERLNYVFQNRVDGYAFPVSAYRVGDEFMLSHNWVDDFAFLKVSSAGTQNFYLGLDSNGAAIEDQYIYPTTNAYYYVNGAKLHDVASMYSGDAAASGQFISFSTFNPLEAGVKIGHLIHVKTHAVDDENGTYFITDVGSSNVKIQKNAGFTTQASVDVEIIHDALPLDEFNTNVKDTVIEAFITSSGTLGYNERLNYQDNVSGMKIVDVSDNFKESSYTLTSTVAAGVATIKFTGTYAKEVKIPTTFSGKVKIPSPHLTEYVVAEITSPIGGGTSAFEIYSHVNEEEVLELCSVRLDGLTTLSSIVDKRLFGTLGLDELREDVVQAYVETPNKELRSNGVISGLEVIDSQYQDPSFPLSSNFFGLLIRGGTAMVDGVRVETNIAPVIFPNTAATYIVALNKLGTFNTYDTSVLTMEELLDGYGEEVALIAQIDHDGATTDPASLVDLRFNISKIDDRVELLFDESNHFIGHFASFDAAMMYINNYPKSEKFKIRVVSHGGGDITVPAGSRDVTIVIDGQVNNIVVDASCKITSESTAFRAEPHVRGVITSSNTAGLIELSNLRVLNGTSGGLSEISIEDGGRYTIDNCVFAGTNVSGQVLFSAVGAESADKITVENSIFESGTAINITCAATMAVINNCEFTGSASDVYLGNNADIMIIDGCTFNNCGFTEFSQANDVKISNSIFENRTTTSEFTRCINAYSVTHITNCTFRSIIASTDDAIYHNETGYRLFITDCFFELCESTVNGKFINSEGTISGCTFRQPVGAGSPGSTHIDCTSFINNEMLFPTQDIRIGAAYISDNIGLQSVSNSASLDLQRVSGNTFVESTVFGYNVKAISTSGMEITNNVFSTGAQIAIDVGAAAGEISIVGNEFAQAGYCINTVVSPTKIVMSSNIINSQYLIQGSGAITADAIITGNVFNHASGHLISGIVGGLSILGNKFVTGALEISASGIQATVISNNLFNGNLTLTGNATGCSITENSFNSGTITMTGDVTKCNISGNVDSGYTFLAFSASNIIDTLITNNNLDLGGISTAILERTRISGNVISNSSVTLKITPSSGSGDYANVIFSENMLRDDVGVILTSSGSIRGVVISDNIGATSSYPTFPSISTTAVLNESVISGNVNLTISLTGGLNACTISNNSSLASSITLSGACNSNIVTNNYLKSLTFSGTSSSGMIFSSNYATDTVAISATGGNIDRLSFTNNSVNGTVTIASTIGEFSNLVINNNTLNSDLILNITGSQIQIFGNTIFLSLTVWSANTASTYAISNMNIGYNVLGAAILIGDVLTSGTYILESSKITGNNTASYMSIFGTGIYGATATFSGNEISGNFCSDILLFISESTHGSPDTKRFTKNRIDSNIISNSITVRAGTSPTYPLIDNLSITNNTMPYIEFLSSIEYSALIIAYNSITDAGDSLSIYIDPVATPGLFEKFTISSNQMNGSCTFSVYSASSTSVNGVIFSNNYADNAGEFKVESATSGVIDLTFKDLFITSNNMRSVVFDVSIANSASSFALSNANITDNFLSGFTAVSIGVSWEPGIYIDAGSITGLGLVNVHMDRNTSAGTSTTSEIVIIADNALISFTNSSISDNRYINIDLDAATSLATYAMTGSYIQRNNATTISMAGFLTSVSRCIFGENNVTTMNLSGLGSGGLGGAIENTAIAGNIVTGTLTLPARTKFTNTASQSKIVNNYAATWSCASTFATTGTTNVYVSGNTSGGNSSLVDFNGATTKTEANSNNVSTTTGGTGITN